MDEQDSAMEQEAIDWHRVRMAKQLGREVSLEEAARDWEANYRMKWRAARMERMLAVQRGEIARYKWIESEKAQRDLGRKAALDWVLQHAAEWRERYDESEGSGIFPEIYE